MVVVTDEPVKYQGVAIPGDQVTVLHRDRLDKKVLADLGACKGEVIDRPGEAGGWTDVKPAEPPPDTDGDLLPDKWESDRRGLDPAQANDPWQPNARGVPAVEAWLAALAGDE